MKETSLNAQNSLYLDEPLDTWLNASQQDFAVPEAAGSSARVFLLKDSSSKQNFRRDPAIKIMRPDKISYAKPLFIEEYKILAGLHGQTALTPMIQSGFLKLDDGSHLPAEIAPLSEAMKQQGQGTHLRGKLALFDVEETQTVLDELEQRLQDGWLPLLILERRWEENLYLLCDAGYTRGNFVRNLSMKQALDIASQICTILEQAHARGASFLDHKLLHYYWNSLRQKVIILDWNIGHWQGSAFSPEIQRADMLQFSARALHHIFTGRQAPGSVAVGPNRPEDIANSPSHFKASYSFDVQNRLNRDEMAFLEKAIDGGFTNPTEMKENLAILAAKR